MVKTVVRPQIAYLTPHLKRAASSARGGFLLSPLYHKSEDVSSPLTVKYLRCCRQIKEAVRIYHAFFLNPNNCREFGHASKMTEIFFKKPIDKAAEICYTIIGREKRPPVCSGNCKSGISLLTKSLDNFIIARIALFVNRVLLLLTRRRTKYALLCQQERSG